ncbi:MAG TPA: DHA2 family efflux MFS transporter permease subunit [Thermoleophilia bacterium]|nr:DHA2 family efflux MFS transporter permease subunit [Thermoleophilia bacterium]
MSARRDTSGADAGRSPWAILAVLCIGLFMILLDGTIVNIAIPHIMTSLDTGLSGVEWVMNAYILAFAVTLVTLGRLGDLYGRRKLYVTGMALFTLASLACGLAPSISWLIGFRVIQGLGGAAMMPATLSIVAAVFPPGKRGAAMGVWGGVSGLATAIGPSLGGLIVDGASWRWIFLINIPIGVIGVILALRLVPESRNRGAVETLDLPGVGLFSISLFCLTFALIEGQNYGWTSLTILGLFATALIGFLLFYLHEHRVHQPLIDFSLFRKIDFLAGNITGLLLSASMMGVFFMVPIFLQTVLGFSALKAGLVMSPMSVVIIFAAPLAGMVSDRVGSKWIVALGMLLLAFGIAWMAGLTPWHERLTPDTTPMMLLFPFIIAGIGIGLAVAPVTSAVMATAPPDRVGNASGVLSTMRQVGSLMGIAILGAVLQNRITANVSAGLETVKGLPEALKQTILDGLSAGGMQMSMPGGTEAAPGAAQQLMATLFKTWFTDAINTTFIVGVAFALGGAFCALLLRAQPQRALQRTASADAQGESPAVDGSAPVVTPDDT